MISYISDKNVVADTDKNTTKRLSLGERLRGTYRNDWWEFSLNGSLDYTHSRNSYQESNNMDTYQFLMVPVRMCVCRGICLSLLTCLRTPEEGILNRA